MNVETPELTQEPEAASPAVVENEIEAQEAEEIGGPVSIEDPFDGNPDEEGEIEDEGDGAELATDAPEFVTIEHDGEEYDVPPALKDAFMRNKDYTQKNQARAAAEKELQEQRETLVQREQLNNVELDAIMEIRQIDTEFQHYDQFTPADWDAAFAEDRFTAEDHWRKFQLLKEQRNTANQKLHQAQQHKQSMMQSEQTKRVETTEQYARENIPGWNKEMDAQIREFAADRLKLTPERFNSGVDQHVYDALHLAWVGAKALQNQAKAASVNAKLKPTRRISSRTGGGSSDPSKMSMDDYKKWADKKFKDS